LRGGSRDRIQRSNLEKLFRHGEMVLGKTKLTLIVARNVRSYKKTSYCCISNKKLKRGNAASTKGSQVIW